MVDLARGLSDVGNTAPLVKPADQSVTSSTALVDATGLVVGVGANQMWVIEWLLRLTFGATGLVQVAVTVPSGATLLATATMLSDSATAALPAAGSATTSGAGISLTPATATTGTARVIATVQTGATPGNVALQFAQAVSNGTATTVKALSSCLARRVS